MTYIDKRALQNGESELSLTPYVNLNQVIQDIIDPQVFPTPSDDISFSTQTIGNLDISELNGQYFTALDLGVFSTTNSLEDVAKDISPCKFAKMTFTVTNNTSNQDVIIWLLSGETQIGTVTILAEQTGDFKATGDFDNPEYLSICFNITGGSGNVDIGEITTTFTTGEPIIPPEPPVELTAGDWIDITDGVISFSGGRTTNEKRLITTLSADVDGVTYKGTVDRILSVSEGDKFLHSLVDETNEKTLNSSITRVKPTDFSYLVSKYEDGVSVGDTVLEVAIDQITLLTADGTYGNTLSFKSTDTSISAYPNTRNDYPTGDPVNLLTTDANGKIQSFNTGITADISILGITLRFANGVLVEYIP